MLSILSPSLKLENVLAFLKHLSIGSKETERTYFTKQTLVNAMSFLSSSLLIALIVFKQDIGLPVGIDQAPFWANSFFISLNLSI